MNAPKASTAYLYIRVSSQQQVDSGLSLEAQHDGAAKYVAYLQTQERYSTIRRVETLSEKGVSAWKTKLVQRPEGEKLDRLLCAGDHVIFVRLDRAFRNTKDFINTFEDWSERGVSIHFLDLGIDLGTPVGRLMGTVLAAFAQWESDLKSSRIRETVKVSRKDGRLVNGKPDRGHMIIGRKHKRQIVDREKVKWARLACFWRSKGYFPTWISNHFEEMLARKANRKPRPIGFRTCEDSWTPPQVRRYQTWWTERGRQEYRDLLGKADMGVKLVPLTTTDGRTIWAKPRPEDRQSRRRCPGR